MKNYRILNCYRCQDISFSTNNIRVKIYLIKNRSNLYKQTNKNSQIQVMKKVIKKFWKKQEERESEILIKEKN